MIRTSLVIVLLAPFVLPRAAAHAQEMQDVEIETLHVAEGVYMLVGPGGNIGLSIGDDGAFLVDDKYAPLTDKILAAVAAVTDQDIRFVVNTHFHGDHTGGNENMGETGAIIVAHENVRLRLSTEQFNRTFDRRTPPSPPGALPVVTFTDAVTFHWNGDEIHVFHVDSAHTDGDAIIDFRRANVIHAGDLYFNGIYPFIDVDAGGSIDGTIAAVEQVLAVARPDTKIIPGHGPLANVEELRTYGQMLATVRARVKRLIAEGKTKDEVIATEPTQQFDEKWGGGFLNPDRWVGILYESLRN